MKISLFYKPSALKVYSFLLLFSLIFGAPAQVSADFFSNGISVVKEMVLGTPTQASETVSPTEENGVIHNLQTIPLLESSFGSDFENINSIEGSIIIGDEALLPGNFGIGIENISSGEIMTYEVKEGDTLSEIAEEFNVSMNTIRWENNFSGNSVRVGQKLKILPVTGVKHIIKKGDTLAGIANKYDAELDDILIFNGLSKTDSIKQGDTLIVPNGVIKTSLQKASTNISSPTSSSSKVSSGYFIRPTTGIITSPYGSRWGSFHYGIDIGNKRGTPVIAAASGVVVSTLSTCKEGISSCGGRYGNYIVIEHSNGMTTRYAHLSKVSVTVGQKVSQGKVIGAIGNTGRSTGPHLHFEIERSNGSKMKPVF